LTAAGSDNLAGKTLVDVSNPLDMSGDRPALLVANTDSLGEQIQRAVPEARVVKALNTMNCRLMVDPAAVPGDHVAFVAGDDEPAKAQATALLGEFGWPPNRVIDLGDLSGARAMEMYVMLWVRMVPVAGSPMFNIAVAKSS
jgi:8-hydroxy-5-deazaflavin:NADPH oxidoreductase